jgi:hypothetical protein
MEPIIEFYVLDVSKDTAKGVECALISKYGRRDNHTGILTNRTNGGDGGDTISNHPNKKNICFGSPGERNGMYGKTHTKEAKTIQSETAKKWHEEHPGARSGDNNVSKRPEVRKKLSIKAQEREINMSDEEKNKRVKRMTGLSGDKNPAFGCKHKKQICVHCGKEVAKGMHTRWHGDNCKHQPTINETGS